MLWILLIILGIIFAIYGVFSYSNTGDKLMAIGFPMIMVGFVALIISLFVAEIAKNDHEMKRTPWADLAALNDGSQIEGRFGIFSGTIDQKNYYFYYYKDYQDGELAGYKQSQVPVQDTRIIEKADAPAQLVKIEDAECHDDVHWWGWDACREASWEIIVPPGTVVQQFKLDLED